MKKVKILHCGDLHFDTPFKELPREISDISKEELLEVFKNIIDRAKEEKVQILLIAGDIFDNLTVNKNTLFFITRELKRISNIHVFISPGNHDPFNEKSFYHIVPWPENVHIFKGIMEGVEIKEFNTTVWGAGFNKSYHEETLLQPKEINNENINIMVLHGELCNKNSVNEYNPIYNDNIEKSKMDYIALGHRHRFSGILREGKTYYSYSGCPQGRGFDEEGEKGIVIGDVFRGGVNLQFESIYKRKYDVSEIDMSECNTYEDICETIINKFNEKERKNNLYKIILKGSVKDHLNIKEHILEEKLKAHFYFIKVIDKTTVAIDLQDLSKDFSLKGRFIGKILDKLNSCESEEEREVINISLKLGMQCLSEEVVNLDDN